MSYAEAAGSKSNEETNYIPKDYFNEKLLVCNASGFSCLDVADALNKEGIMYAVTGLQSLDFTRKIGIVIDDQDLREKIVVKGLVIKEHQVTFDYHKRRQGYRVFVSQLPLRITKEDLSVAFSQYGSIANIHQEMKWYYK